MAKVGKRVYYRGTVQGVGFRQTARMLAHGFAVVGYVRNLPDGRVELVAEGEADAVARFLAALSQRLADCIRDQDVQDEPPQDHDGFDVR